MTDARATPRAALRFLTLLAFVRSESAGGVVLMLSAVVAMVWANAMPASYHAAVARPLLASIPALTLQHAVNDGLMVLFFLLVGLEIRREMMEGQLASLSRVAAPALAAAGGMIVPALIFAALNCGHLPAMRGWAIPVATDIAFSLAVLQLLGRRVPGGLKVFLTALAIIDDIGAIAVIALFYSHDFQSTFAAGALAVCVGLLVLNRAGVRALWPYCVGGLLLWVLVAGSGVHATLAGVVLAFLVPMGERPGEAASPGRRLEEGLGSIVAWLVLPLFGLANAGLQIAALPQGALTSPLVLGIVGGLFLGKQAGIFGVTRAAAALGIARLPHGLTWLQVYGVSVLCGIGFTMSLFVAELAYAGWVGHDEAKLAVLVGSLISAFAGLAVLACAPVKAPALTRPGA
ncbi:MAG: Na+/H+ antiporter NhaA [Acidisphaera sp.]|nr:Na+/H+ antiporter NhaA [Acidisphaera sp.]MBV9813099.1 Na+/H+ antiporter NhaA [Acetobacteraceae bacterium]